MNAGVGADRAGAADYGRVDRRQSVAAPELRRAHGRPLDHAFDERPKVRSGSPHLLVQAHWAKARPARFRHHRDRLPKREIRPRVQEDEPK